MSAPDLSGVTGPPGWMARALCAQVDPELFYPEKGDSTQAAKKVCSRCPVRVECLAYALARDERFGVWGGRSVPERGRTRTRPVPGAGSGREVDVVVVARLIAGHPVAGATRTELAQAAVGLHRGGWAARRIATRLGVHPRQVQRWVTRYRRAGAA